MFHTLSSADLRRTHAERITADSFDPARHLYPRAQSAQIHGLVAHFFRLQPEQIVERYCHLNPIVDAPALAEILRTHAQYLHWAGADLFYTVSMSGVRRMVVLETNSCPSGNKSMPLLTDEQEHGGYRRLLETCFMPLLKRRGLPRGGLAVLYDKNYMENSGYAATLADLAGEDVFLAPLPAGDPNAPDAPGAPDDPDASEADRAARFRDEVLEVRDPDGAWIPIRAAFRYVTKRPWDRIPFRTRTAICNPLIACLGGGRNKLVASKAYEFLNADLAGSGLAIRTPETIRDVRLEEVPLWVRRFGGFAVVKNPYANAGTGVWTITSDTDLTAFTGAAHRYDRFIVQALIGNATWTSDSREGSRYYHVGTVPTRKGEIYVADLRVMVCSGPDGFRPISVYARRARDPLTPQAPSATRSWGMLGTNLSVARDDGGWDADTDRLVIMDRRDFNRLGVGLDDLIDAYIQAVLSVTAIDRMCEKLVGKRGALRRRLFRSLVDDASLLAEILKPPERSERATP